MTDILSHPDLIDYPMVSVDWIDSNMAAGWHQQPDMLHTVNLGKLLCRSVGYVFSQTPERLTLISGQADTGSVCDATTIPRIAIRSISLLAPSPSPFVFADGETST